MMSDSSIRGQPDSQPPVMAELALRKTDRKWLVPLLLLVSHLAMLSLGLLLGGILKEHQAEQRASTKFDSLAVLPFTGDWQLQDQVKDWPENSREFLAVSLPDAISKDIVAKAPSGSLKVIATHVVRGRIVRPQSPQESGRELNVTAVLSGSVTQNGELTLQLIAVESGELLWSGTYTLGVNGGNPEWSRFHVPPQAGIVESVIKKLTGPKK